MNEDKKRRSSILKVSDRLKSNEKNKRKRVSFAPNEILHEFDMASENASAANSMKRSKINYDEKSPQKNRKSTIKKNNKSPSKLSEKDIENITNSPIIPKNQNIFDDIDYGNFNQETEKPLDIAETLLNMQSKKITRSQIDSILFDNSLLEKSNIRRSPRLSDKIKKNIDDSIRVPSDNLLNLETLSPADGKNHLRSPRLKKEVDTVKENIKLNIDDIFDENTQNLVKNEQIKSYSMEISLSPPHIKTEDIINQNLSKCVENTQKILTNSEKIKEKENIVSSVPLVSNKILGANLETIDMESSSIVDLAQNYINLAKKSKEHQQKIFNVSQELRSLLSMSISECADIANQSSSLIKNESRNFVIPDQNTLKMINIYRDLKIINNFICKKMNSKHKTTSQEDYIRLFNDSTYNYISKTFEFDKFSDAKREEMKNFVEICKEKLANLTEINSKYITSQTFVKLSKQIYQKYKVYSFILNDSTIRIYHEFKMVYYDISNITDDHINCFIKFSINDQFSKIFIDKITFLKQKSIHNLSEFVKVVITVNSIYFNLHLLYEQMDFLATSSGCVRYENEKIGFKCFSHGIFSFIIWMCPIINENNSISMKYLYYSDLIGDISSNLILEKIKELLDKDFEVLSFYSCLKKICQSSNISDL